MPKKSLLNPIITTPILDDDLLSRIFHEKQKTGITYKQLIAKYLDDSITPEQLRLRLRLYKASIMHPQIPEPSDILFDEVIHLPNDHNITIIADLHAPYQNAPLLRQVFRLSEIAGVDELDIAGDLHNFAELSSLTRHEKVVPYTTDIDHSRNMLYTALNFFDTITIDLGNHDEYYLKKKSSTHKELIHDVVLRGHYIDRVNVTEYDYHLRGDSLLIGHLSSFDETPGNLAAKLANMHNRNVLVGHDHLRGWKLSDDGNYVGFSIGAMLTPSHFWYKQRRLSILPRFQLGFIMIKDGIIYDFDEYGNTNYHGINRTWREWEDYFKGMK
jgi:predicted phosphodiesterase